MSRAGGGIPICDRSEQVIVMIPSSNNFEKRRRGGFTLIEVLATMVLLGIVLPVALRGTSVALQAASHARHTSEAATLADSKINELATMIQGGQVVSSGMSGDFPEHTEYHWSCSSAIDVNGLNELSVQVTWTERAQERVFTLTTLVNPQPTL